MIYILIWFFLSNESIMKSKKYGNFVPIFFTADDSLTINKMVAGVNKWKIL